MSMPAERPIHCLSFDVEEHFQVSAFWSDERRQQWDHLESRVEGNTEKILSLLSSRGVLATFFVLGWVAERCPSIVRRIVEAGHELASHGYGHELVSHQSPMAFREDIRKSKKILEDISGHAVLGYRAPSFSITKRSIWALAILAEEGYRYDSSVFPILHDSYGIPDASPVVHQIHTDAGPLWEVPPSTLEFAGVRLPIAGGGYFRMCPYQVFRTLLRRAEQTSSPLVTYFHPWELDPEQPRMDGPWLSRFRHYTNISKTEQRLSRLLDDFRFSSIHSVIEPIKDMRAAAHRVFGSGATSGTRRNTCEHREHGAQA